MRRSVVVLLIAALALVGCSSGSSSGSSSTTTAGSGATTTAAGGGDSTAGASIPDNPAIDALTSDLTKPKAADLVAKCNVLATTVLGKTTGLDNDPAVKESLGKLVAVVRPLAADVADALAKDAAGAAAWCKAKGMTTF